MSFFSGPLINRRDDEIRARVEQKLKKQYISSASRARRHLAAQNAWRNKNRYIKKLELDQQRKTMHVPSREEAAIFNAATASVYFEPSTSTYHKLMPM